MEFYSTIKKNQILSLVGKCMERENSVLSELAGFTNPKAACFLSFAEYRPNTNASNVMKNRPC
jgi:hypothetical protein